MQHFVAHAEQRSRPSCRARSASANDCVDHSESWERKCCSRHAGYAASEHAHGCDSHAARVAGEIRSSLSVPVATVPDADELDHSPALPDDSQDAVATIDGGMETARLDLDRYVTADIATEYV